MVEGVVHIFTPSVCFAASSLSEKGSQTKRRGAASYKRDRETPETIILKLFVEHIEGDLFLGIILKLLALLTL